MKLDCDHSQFIWISEYLNLSWTWSKELLLFRKCCRSVTVSLTFIPTVNNSAVALFLASTTRGPESDLIPDLLGQEIAQKTLLPVSWHREYRKYIFKQVSEKFRLGKSRCHQKPSRIDSLWASPHWITLSALNNRRRRELFRWSGNIY